MKKVKHMLAVAALMTIMTGCGNDDDNNNTAMNDDNNNTANNLRDNSVGYKTDERKKANLDVADKAADKVKDMKEVKRAVVMKTDENAFVAVQLEGNQENGVTNKLEDKIADRVKDTDKDIDNVYVSSNPDFFDRFSNYANDIEDGKPISGLYDEFVETIRRVFPNSR
ncbi:YhcN/YlaJ family sporulation lipoprotein [Niallia taxi]|uniref:YhcN/YlaJ family sporulation lipoprotein n=1 Tax=Niallia taxi TaxID=2499688 RepID=A0A437KEP3_9BACI|nr:YhcN/YlaJ family sporulation lipoprotein [Niallia taxi]MDK8641770.1 YhcN/YlaJ family sporulation lipoprotein [Niallia taxi]RVT65559.1 YhcN/YlaJ family sporulation lipoprotein [Niallia taxi]